jgi:hypothetical protein
MPKAICTATHATYACSGTEGSVMAMDKIGGCKIDPSEIVSGFEDMLRDPVLNREVKNFVKTIGYISSAELDRQFTC